MSDSNSTTGFKKTKFRPWNDNLKDSLKDNIDNEDLFSNSFNRFSDNLDLLANDLDLSLNSGINTDFVLSNGLNESEFFKFDEEDTTNQAPKNHVATTAEEQQNQEDELKHKLRQTMREKSKLNQQLESESKSSVSFGGFIQAQQSIGAFDRNNSEKIRNLKSDLQSKEQEIYTLTANLKISQAIERAEQSENARVHEVEARKKAEARMSQAIDQANIAVQRLHEVIDKFDIAQEAQKEEEKSRRLAEGKIEEANSKAAAAEVNLRSETHARIAAENKAQTSVNQTIQTELAKQQIEEELYQIKKQLELTEAKLHDTEYSRSTEEKLRREVDRDFAELKRLYSDTSDELKKHSDKVLNLEYITRQLEDKNKAIESKYVESFEKAEKFKKIIESEREIRRLADKKMKEAMARATQAEADLAEESKQRKLTDERAKKAVAHATKTVMQFLNSSEEDMEELATSGQLPDLNKLHEKKFNKLSMSSTEE